MLDDWQLDLLAKLDRLADYAGKENDDDSRTLIAELEEDLKNMQRAAAREGFAKDPRLTVGDVMDFAAEIRQDFPKAAKGCEVFASIALVEQQEGASDN